MNTLPPAKPLFAYPAPDPERPYVYPGTQTLINLFGISDMSVLQRVVDALGALRGEQIERIAEPGEHDLNHLCAIHRRLFQDVFAWAGQIRTVDTRKQGQDFVAAADIPGHFARLHQALRDEGFLRGLDADAFSGRLARYWYAVYAIHPFRDGNSRAMRHFFAGLAEAAGYRLDYSRLEPGTLLNASRERYFKNDPEPLHDCLRRITAPI